MWEIAAEAQRENLTGTKTQRSAGRTSIRRKHETRERASQRSSNARRPAPDHRACGGA